MARAENQGLQIALIVFVMLTIVLAVVTFLYVRNFQESVARNAQLEKAAQDDKANAIKMQAEITFLMERVGVDPKMPVGQEKKDEENAAGTVKGIFQDDMKQFAATLPSEKQQYRGTLESLWNTNQELFAANTDMQNKFKELQDQFTRREEERDRQIKEFRDKSDDSAKDLLERQTTFDSDRQRINASNEDLNSKLAQKDAEKSQISDQAIKKEAALGNEIKTLAQTNQLQNDKVKKLTKSHFEVAQGVVRAIDLNGGKEGNVYINLGREDQLTPLVTFSVHAKEANTSQGEGLKARIEVTDILGDHLARARILDEDYANPIAPDDKIYTPLWHPGQRTHVAIFGTIDLDGDGEDDRAIVKDLVTSVGGIIDAEMDPLGKITGNIDINTRFLLEGKIPADRDANIGATAMITKADQAGVERIPMSKFVELSGWKDPRQVVRFGRNGTRERIPAEQRDGSLMRSATPTEAANFQKRRPYQPNKPVKADTE
jgi:hypothetical protein